MPLLTPVFEDTATACTAFAAAHGVVILPDAHANPCPWCRGLAPAATRALVWMDRRMFADRPGGRWYVAFNRRTAVLRLKDSAGLQEWKTRRWTLFPFIKPRIVEVSRSLTQAVVERAEWPNERREVTGLGFDLRSLRVLNYGAGDMTILDLGSRMQCDLPIEAYPMWTPRGPE
jgi:hypothetical protein